MTASESALEAVPWNRLIRDIHNGQVLPVIGPGLVTIQQNGQTTQFADWVAHQLAKRLDIPAAPDMTLNRAACAHLVNRGKRIQIYEEVREIVEENDNLPIPQGLIDLASIRDFDLFISSTFDGFLGKALKRARPGYRTDDRGAAAFHPNRPIDLPTPLPSTFLYHVLGSYDTYPDFAVWEEDYMEFICGLLESHKDNLKNLFKELRNRSLLLIGAPFGDWIVRFFLRVAKQERLSDRRGATDDYLADQPLLLGDPMIFYFDKVVGSPHIIQTSPVEFVQTLRRKWSEKYEAFSTQSLLESIPDDMERGAVFISYSHDDLEMAATLAAGLKAAGIPVWLDVRRLQAGGDWEQALKRAVKSRSALFLSLISKATDSNADRFVHKERLWAAEVHVPGEIFYIPVVIDETELGVMGPEIFKPIHRHRLPGGIVTSDFARLLQKYMTQYHEEGEVRDV